MKNKIFSVLVFVALVYVLPLVAKPDLIVTFQIAIFVVITIILFQTQPAFSIAESKEKKQTDGFSILAILIACFVAQLSSIIEWAYFREAYHQFSLDMLTSIGLILIIGGTIFRVWCIQTLGKYFTSTVQTQTNQQIITTGAYSAIRHPSYLGAYLTIVGGPVLLHAYVSIIISAVVLFAAYWYRIKVEETTLVLEFGDKYKTYQSRTKKIFPYVY